VGRKPTGSCKDICTKDQNWLGGHDGECIDKVCFDWGESWKKSAAQQEMTKSLINVI
jgi:hypothetical protein